MLQWKNILKDHKLIVKRGQFPKRHFIKKSARRGGIKKHRSLDYFLYGRSQRWKKKAQYIVSRLLYNNRNSKSKHNTTTAWEFIGSLCTLTEPHLNLSGRPHHLNLSKKLLQWSHLKPFVAVPLPSRAVLHNILYVHTIIFWNPFQHSSWLITLYRQLGLTSGFGH